MLNFKVHSLLELSQKMQQTVPWCLHSYCIVNNEYEKSRVFSFCANNKLLLIFLQIGEEGWRGKITNIYKCYLDHIVTC